MSISECIKKIFMLPIRFYKRFISPIFPPMCKYYPSCSSYALTSIERFGVIKGGIMAIWRLLRCNPYSNGGVDYVPEKFGLYFLKHKNVIKH